MTCREGEFFLENSSMKKYLTITSMSLAVFLCSCGKKEATETNASNPDATTSDGTYILASNNPFPPVGKTYTRSIITETKDGKIEYQIEENQISGTTSHRTETVETIEPITEHKLRHVIVSESDKGTTVVNGQEQPQNEDPNALLGIPVIVEVKDGKITATLENGTPTEEQESALDEIRENYETNDDFVMYGNTPRKPGDRWEADPSKLGSFAGGNEFSGSLSVEFKNVEEINGIKCANLAMTFDMTGIIIGEDDEPQAEMAIKGKADVIRSIEDRIDIVVKLTGTMTMEGEVENGVTMKIKSPVTMEQSIALK